MRHRQILALFLAAAMTVQMAACGTTGVSSAPADETASAQADAATTEAAETEGTETAATDDTESGETTESTETDAVDKDSVLANVPAVGDVIHGFTVTDVQDYDACNSAAKLVSLNYEQTGTEVLYIATDDADKQFRVAFRTADTTDKGIPHIFEHVTLSGGSKYPNSDLFDRLESSAYITNMNAGTMQHITHYILSSLDDAQLLSLADFYLDGLFSPIALEESNPLGRESSRLVLDSADGEITVTGAVYNEMESDNAGMEAFADRELWRLLRPDSSDANVFGGYREDILTVTLDELQSFHDQYYHPSNMLVLLYGDLDYESYLALVESYIKDYEEQEITLVDGYTEWTGSKEVTMTYPDVAGAAEEDASEIVYAISLDGISLYDRTNMLLVIPQILNAGYLQAAVSEAFPSATLTIDVDRVHAHPAMTFTLSGANPDDGEQFRQIVDDAIDDICENGLDETLVNTLARGLANQSVTSPTSGGDACDLFALNWALYGELLSQLDGDKAEKDLVENAGNGYYQTLIETWLQDPAQTVLLTCNPEAGLQEQVDAAFAEKLATQKANMTDEEVEALVAATADYNTWSEEQAASADQYLDQLRVTDLQSLPEDVTTTEVSDETTESGVRLLTSIVDDMKYVKSDIYLNADTLSYDEIHDLKFLSDLYGELATADHGKDALQTAITGTTISLYTAVRIAYDAAQDDQPHPYLYMEVQSMPELTDDAMTLAAEILETTDLTNAAEIRSAAVNARYNAVSNASEDPRSLARLTGLAALDDNYRYVYYISGPDYLDYLSEVAAMSDEEMEDFLARLQDARDRLLNTNGMIYTVIGTDDQVEAATTRLETLTKDYSQEALEPVDYTADLAKLDLPDSIALAIDDSVNFNGVYALAEDTGLTTGKGEAAAGVLHGLLWYPQLRYRIGAYGFGARVYEDYSLLVSFRDPDIAPTYDYYETIPEEIRSTTFTKEQVEDGAISVYSSLATPDTSVEAAENEINYHISNETQTYADELVARMQSIKTITVEDIEAMADTMQAFLDKGVYVTVGNSTAINKNKDRYDRIITTYIK